MASFAKIVADFIAGIEYQKGYWCEYRIEFYNVCCTHFFLFLRCSFMRSMMSG